MLQFCYKNEIFLPKQNPPKRVFLDLNYCPLVCERFTFGLVFQDFGEFLLAKFKLFLGIVVEASLVHFSNQLSLFHRLLLLENYLYCFVAKETRRSGF
jgi:hypothetical protein